MNSFAQEHGESVTLVTCIETDDCDVPLAESVTVWNVPVGKNHDTS